MLPKRPGPYILTLLLIVLLVVVAWMFHALSSPELTEAVSRKNKGSPTLNPESVIPALAPGGPVTGPQYSAGGVDFELQAKADILHSPEHSPQRDLELVAEFLEVYARAMGGQPIGDNADITAAISGTQYPGQKGRVFPKNHRAVRDGKIVDRWGEPLWFHPNSGNSMEIRSAGPDKQMFTPDDVILNPSPGGFGATPPSSGEMPQ